MDGHFIHDVIATIDVISIDKPLFLANCRHRTLEIEVTMADMQRWTVTKVRIAQPYVIFLNLASPISK